VRETEKDSPKRDKRWYAGEEEEAIPSRLVVPLPPPNNPFCLVFVALEDVRGISPARK